MNLEDVDTRVKNEKVTHNEWVDIVNDPDRPKEQRYGQWAFNTLLRVKPELANEIRGGVLDPFHKTQGSFPQFFIYVAQHWNKHGV